jgi:predicted dehydrogenase
MARKVHWGIIGCGDVTEKKSGPGFRKVQDSELVAVMRRDVEKARDYAERHGVPRWYGDAGELIADREVDAVYIATPPSTHAEYCIRAAQAGKPVYVEKPMALNGTEARRMVEACRKSDVPLYVAYYRRTLPRFGKVKELVDEGAIGDVRVVQTSILTPASPQDAAEEKPWRVLPEISGGGYFFDLAAHSLDYLDFLLGPIAKVHGIAGNQGGFYAAEDSIGASWRFENGVIGTGTWCFDAAHKADANIITGTEGEIRFSTLGTEPVELRRGDEQRRFAIENPEHVQQPLIQTIVDELLGRGNCPSTGESALRTTLVMDEIVADYYRNGASD